MSAQKFETAFAKATAYANNNAAILARVESGVGIGQPVAKKQAFGANA